MEYKDSNTNYISSTMSSSRQRRPTQKILDTPIGIKKTRRPPTCRICPNRPLKKNCGCSGKKKGRILTSQVNFYFYK